VSLYEEEEEEKDKKISSRAEFYWAEKEKSLRLILSL
jgi:hypothetical protein